jgi:cytochrome c-type protein NapB
MVKTTLITLTTLGLLSVTASAFDTKACAGCHGENFEKSALNKSKIVKDLTAEEITKALKGYKDGTYGGAMKGIMKGQVAKLSDDDIKDIAEKYGKK